MVVDPDAGSLALRTTRSVSCVRILALFWLSMGWVGTVIHEEPRDDRLDRNAQKFKI